MSLQADSAEKPSVIVISSHVARGSVGSRAAVFALEAFGFPVWSIPTVVLPWHPGHMPSTKLVFDDELFALFVADISNAPWIDEVSAVFTGYMASEKQVEVTAELIASLKEKNPKLTYVCDPVLGDNEALYVSEEVASAIRDRLIPVCDVATPNRFELSWLASKPLPKDQMEILALAKSLAPRTVLVTSLLEKKSEMIGNLLSAQTGSWAIWHEKVSNAPNGTGDLTAALYLARILTGESNQQALAKVTSSVFEVVNYSVEHDKDELALESTIQSLINPTVGLSALPASGGNP